jgi:PAS domain S-box-containing protein
MNAIPDKQFSKQWILTFTILTLLATALAYERFLDRRRIESVEQERLLIQARVVDDNLSHQLVATYEAVRRIVSDLPQLRSRGSYRQPMANLTLKTLEEAMPGVRTLLILDAKGIVRASSRSELMNRDFSRRKYFQIVRRHPDPVLLYLSPPYITVLNVYAMSVSYMVPGPSGEFKGLVVTALDPEYFKTLLSSVLYAPDMSVAIVHGDGIQFLMLPNREGQSGKNLAQPGSFFSRYQDSGRRESILSGIVAPGEERLMALRTIFPSGAHLDKPLIVAVGRDPHAIFADWQRDTTIYGVVFIAIIVVTVLTLRYNQIRVMRADEQARAAKTELERNEQKLRDITSSLAEGLYVLNDNGEVLFMNPEAERLLGWTEAELKGRNVHDVVHNRQPDGTILPFDECRIHNVIKIGTRFLSHDEMFIRKDGTALPVSVISAPMKEQGGVAASVTAFRDITDIKLAEQEREKLIAELQKALAEIKTLHGILPICSNCKKIRDDEGSWRQMEEYISEHTDSRFSHGLCSDCAQKLYPEYFKKDS